MRSRFVLVLVMSLAGACSRSHDARPVASSSSPPPAPSAPAASSAPERVAAPEPLTCRTLESCTDACGDAACAEACVRRLTAPARPAYDALQACVKPACAGGDAAPCRAPASLACKMCVIARCAAQAATCMKN